MKRHSILVALILGLAISLGAIGCGGDDDNGTGPGVNEFEQLATLGDTYFTAYTTKGGLPVNVDASAVYANITDGNTANDPYIIDWRSADHFAVGHIAGSVNVGVVSSADIGAVIAAVPSGKVVVNVCYTGQTASYATAYMNMLGLEAQNLKYGMNGWTTDPAITLSRWANNKSDNYAGWLVTTPSTATVEYDPPTLSTGQSDPEDILAARGAAAFKTGFKSITPQALYDDFLAGKQGDYFVINYFNAPEYNAGHIPGAIRFQPKQDLKLDAMLTKIPTGKKVVVYCYTGQTSAQVVAYLNMLGYNAYTLTYGVGAMCYSNTAICTTRWTAPGTDYPVVTGS